MFNIIQNAIKYNRIGGLITIKMNLLPTLEQNWLFKTNVIDTGYGIDNQRLPHLLKLFGELKNNSSLQFVKDNGIGIGLTCSKSIVDFLGGKINLSSSRGLTNV
jgi:signal transduction histidine kinase